ncbi:MAG: hypothetical protein KME30_11675 [Iphinoe sp. HA4291-MV1]|jgi:hypothetical protein|nr:hypothetical protein [Iphinoe sp. HA4291-MV1]
MRKYDSNHSSQPVLGYRPQAADTSIEADIFLFNRLRQLSEAQRVQMVATHNRGVRKLCLTGIKWRHPNTPIEEIRLLFAHAVLAEKFHSDFQPTGIDETMWIQDSIAKACELHQLFESINMLYYVSGGVASSIHGEARSTRDLDLVIQVQSNQIDLLVQTLSASGFYCPTGTVEDLKLGRGKILNIIHTETIANADLIVMENKPFAVSQMSRRKLLDIPSISNFWIASPEDTILQKLLWGSQRKSEKQWRDVLGILKLQNDTLDDNYLTEWASRLEIPDLLAQARIEAGEGRGDCG